jgi:hypothetical protein
MFGPVWAECVAILPGVGVLVIGVTRIANAGPGDPELFVDCTDWAPFGIGCKKAAGDSIVGGGRDTVP